MTLKVLAVAAALAAGAAFASHVAPAAALPAAKAQQFFAADSSMAEQVHRRRGGRCFAWRLECADRWGWGTWRFHRCLARHGCGGGWGGGW